MGRVCACWEGDIGIDEGGFGVFHPIGPDKDGEPGNWLPVFRLYDFDF